MSFAEAQTKGSELQLQLKKTEYQRKSSLTRLNFSVCCGG